MVTPPLQFSHATLAPARLAQVARTSISWRGSLEAARVVAIVGSRNPMPESVQFTRMLASACARAGIVVASGGALGVDITAHRAALEAGGSTWAVLATPPDRFFPPENGAFLQALPARGGTVVWTAAPSAKRTPRSFHLRNKVLMALCDVAVVVQASARSGSLHAGGRALALGKRLFVVPGAPWDEAFAGCLDLLKKDGHIITSADQVLRCFGTEWALPATPARAPPPGVPPELLGTISQVPLFAEEIAKRAQLDMATTLSGLLTLSLENVVVEDLGGRYRLA